MCMENMIFILIVTVALGAMVVTSNMETREKRSTVSLMTAMSIMLAVYFNTPDYFYLVPAILVGCGLGWMVNRSSDKKRKNYLMAAMKEGKSF